jgi:hypothetical protein
VRLKLFDDGHDGRCKTGELVSNKVRLEVGEVLVRFVKLDPITYRFVSTKRWKRVHEV